MGPTFFKDLTTSAIKYDVHAKFHGDLMCCFDIIIDRIAGKIIRLVASVCVRVRPFVGALLFEPFDL